MGSKYFFKPDSNPPVGAYNIEEADNLVKGRNQSAFIKKLLHEVPKP